MTCGRRNPWVTHPAKGQPCLPNLQRQQSPRTPTTTTSRATSVLCLFESTRRGGMGAKFNEMEQFTPNKNNCAVLLKDPAEARNGKSPREATIGRPLFPRRDGFGGRTVDDCKQSYSTDGDIRVSSSTCTTASLSHRLARGPRHECKFERPRVELGRPPQLGCSRQLFPISRGFIFDELPCFQAREPNKLGGALVWYLEIWKLP